jgi:hypothetical protein
VSVAATIALGAVLGLALGIIVSVTTEVPLAPEAGLLLGGVRWTTSGSGEVCGRKRVDGSDPAEETHGRPRTSGL